jgi:hypothetical protein
MRREDARVFKPRSFSSIGKPLEGRTFHLPVHYFTIPFLIVHLRRIPALALPAMGKGTPVF